MIASITRTRTLEGGHSCQPDGGLENPPSVADWTKQQLGKVLTLNYGWSLAAKNRIEGEFPVYGSNGIVGTHNKPLVPTAGLIVGRKGSAGNVHLSRKPFCPIDTTFYVAPSDTTLDLEFLYYLLLHLDLKRITGDVGVPGLNRDMAYFEPCSFPANKGEQQKIAGVLGVVQRAMEQQERLLALTAELKKALLHQLFTAGLRGEPQKQTEIGPVPESWEVATLASLLEIKHGYAFAGEHFAPQGCYVLLTPGHFFEKGGFRDQKDKTKYYLGEFPRGYLLSKGDLLVAMTEQKAGLLGSAIIVPESEKFLHNQRLGLIQNLDERRLDKLFLFYFFNTASVRKQIFLTSSGSKVRHTSPGKIRELSIAVPSLAEQKEIVQALRAVDAKLEVTERKHTVLAALFRALLHQLMTAQLRVHALDLPKLVGYIQA